MKKQITALFLLLLTAPCALAAQPRLIVQIVVGSMRAEDLDRYAANFGEGGLRRLTEGGTLYADAGYDCQQTVTPVSLATLVTGAQPSTHGVIGTRWMDYVQNKPVSLVEGKKGPSPDLLIAPTLSEELLRQSPDSRAVTVAAEPVSAVVTAGRGGMAFWLDEEHCGWTTSPSYAEELPDPVRHSNRERFNLSYLQPQWQTLLPADKYRNSYRNDIAFSSSKRARREERETPAPLFRAENDYARLLHTPAGNTAVLGMAKQAIAEYKLGADAVPDLLNVCLDASRRIQEVYGPESIEAEDMYYRLDRDLADFLTFVFAQVKNGEAVVVFTSDHGTSPSCDRAGAEADTFNERQFEVLVNSFLNVRYGTGDWVLDYENKSLYLNHNLIYERGLDLADVQNEVAIFAMQFRGVSHALSATAMRTSYFGSGYARKMQNSFYPRRSGDVALNLMPGWIEQRDGCRSASGSMYGYDTDVPLIFYGFRTGPQRIARRVEMTAVAPTLARLLGIRKPAAAEGGPLAEIVE